MNDHISRQEALDAFGLSEKTRKWGGDHSGYNTLMLYEIQDVLEALPSAYPKKGKWIKADRQQYFRKHYPASQCSICGWRKNYSGKYNYCPNCGADMRERNECVD